jgi:hypothetical protein
MDIMKTPATVGISKCQTTGKTYGVRIEQRKNSKWYATWTFPIDVEEAKREGYTVNSFPQNIEYDSDFPGCPFCPDCKKIGNIRIYSPFAGQNDIASASRDKFGNPMGSDYDLIEDGMLKGTIYVLNLCSEECHLTYPKEALRKKGLEITEDISPPNISTFKQRLKDACQFWLISGKINRINNEVVNAIDDYFQQGHGVYVWGDNDPYYVDANLVASKLFNASMSGNTPGDQVISLCTENRKIGVIPGHLLSTGIVNIYEGITIATVQTNAFVKPLIYGSNGMTVAGYYEQDGRRAIIDGGFTRLYHKWNSAGTARYVVNAAIWLANLERYPETLHRR